MKLITILAVAQVIIIALLLIKYKPAYKVTINGEVVGYITNKKAFEELINDKILNPDEKNVAFVEIEQKPEYSLLLIDNNQETNEQQIFTQIQIASVTTYRVFAITLNGEDTTYVNTREEAEEVITSIKEKTDTDEIEIGMQEIYTQDLEKTRSTIEIAEATQIAEANIEEKIKEQQEIKASTFEGIYFSVKPVSGTITSRFGVYESDVRDHTHMGIDIAAPNGTDIQAPAEGVVTHAGWMGGYGNLIIISHGNGIQTYYGHCSKLYVSEGDTVQAGDVIAAVGSTGNSTGNHLHFEIRKNGSQVNPQKYLYR